MIEPFRLHLVDSNSARRERIAHALEVGSIQTEIYTSLNELICRYPSSGGLLICTDGEVENQHVPADDFAARTGSLPVAFFSESPHPQRIVQAMLSGALDYLRWPFGNGVLEAVVERLVYVGQKKAQFEVRKADARQRVGRLTRRELEVLKAVADGGSNKSIARGLGISPRTVEIHRANLMSRLDAQSTADAVRFALYAEMTD